SLMFRGHHRHPAGEMRHGRLESRIVDRHCERRSLADPLTFCSGRRIGFSEGTMNRIRTALAVAFLFCSAAAFAAIDSPIHRTFNVAPGGTLTLDADVGDIRVTSGGNGVTVDVKRRARSEGSLRDFTVMFDQQGNNVSVNAKYNRP